MEFTPARQIQRHLQHRLQLPRPPVIPAGQLAQRPTSAAHAITVSMSTWPRRTSWRISSQASDAAVST